MMFSNARQNRKLAWGQGVVEYAGALIIAVILITTSMVVIPPNFAEMMNTICTTVASFLISQLPT
jgi:hypothetical protein